MKTALMFEAVCNGNVFGVLALDRGLVTAQVGHMLVTGVLFGHALMWVRERRPDPFQNVEFRLSRVSHDGDSSSVADR